MDSYTVDYNNGDAFQVTGNKLHLPKIGWVDMAEEFRFANVEGMKLLYCTVSKEAGEYYASISCSIPTVSKQYELPFEDNTGSSDIGTREFVDSDGHKEQVPRAYVTQEKKLKRRQRSYPFHERRIQ